MIGAQPAQILSANRTVLFCSGLYAAVPFTSGSRSDGLNLYSFTVVILEVSGASAPALLPEPADPLVGIDICGSLALLPLFAWPPFGAGLMARYAANATSPATTINTAK